MPGDRGLRPLAGLRRRNHEVRRRRARCACSQSDRTPATHTATQAGQNTHWWLASSGDSVILHRRQRPAPTLAASSGPPAASSAFFVSIMKDVLQGCNRRTQPQYYGLIRHEELSSSQKNFRTISEYAGRYGSRARVPRPGPVTRHQNSDCTQFAGGPPPAPNFVRAAAGEPVILTATRRS